MTANNSISLAQFDYAVKFEEEYREAIASGDGDGDGVKFSEEYREAIASGGSF